jgi:hypothetical protein
LRLSNDLIWTQREIVTALGAEERMLWKKTTRRLAHEQRAVAYHCLLSSSMVARRI